MVNHSGVKARQGLSPAISPERALDHVPEKGQVLSAISRAHTADLIHKRKLGSYSATRLGIPLGQANAGERKQRIEIQ